MPWAMEITGKGSASETPAGGNWTFEYPIKVHIIKFLE